MYIVEEYTDVLWFALVKRAIGIFKLVLTEILKKNIDCSNCI